MYADRHAAGERLATEVTALEPGAPVVLALPRGGVPVAAPVAQALGAPLDLILVRKLGLPQAPEVAAGAVVAGAPEHVVWNDAVLAGAGFSRSDMDPVLKAERARNAARRDEWLGGRAPLPLAGRTAIVVDDGIATGATLRAALMALHDRGPARVVLAIPVAPPDALADLAPLVDDVICPERPVPFRAVGLHYRDFAEVSDAEVIRLLAACDGNADDGSDNRDGPDEREDTT